MRVFTKGWLCSWLMVGMLLGCRSLTEPPDQAPGVPTIGPSASLVPSVVPVPSPVSYWSAEGSYADVADGDNNGIPIGGVAFAPGKIGLAFALDGTGEIEISHSPDLELADGNASMTIAAWVKPELPLQDVFGLAAVVSFNYACSEPAIGIHVTDTRWHFSPYTNGVLFGVRDQTAVLYDVGLADTWLDGAWHHIISVRDGPADQVRLYIDGQLRAAGPDLSGTIQPLRDGAGNFVVAPQNGGQIVSSPHRIGAVAVPCATKRFFVGLIDEVKVWSVVLTDAQAELEFLGDTEGPLVVGVALSPNPVPVQTGVSLDATVDDGTTGNSIITSAAYAIDGGSFIGMNAADGAFDAVVEGVSASIPAFPQPGVHDVCVRGTDVSGNAGLSACALVAVYDPSAGFVTGGGWITSPPGAYGPDPALSGKASFGFVSKYQKGTTVPSGNTQFKFKAAGFEFASTSYEWLVVAGARAQYKGSGTIGGMGDYGFMLTAIDGALPGGGGVDKFRIKIWNKGSGGVIYDNQSGAADTADPTTAIQAGEIVIHE